MSKYEKLWIYVENINQDILTLTFGEIKNILGFDIDHSFLNYKKELLSYNYEVNKISLKEKYVIFNRINSNLLERGRK